MLFEAAVLDNPGEISTSVVEDQSVGVEAVPGSSGPVVGDGTFCVFLDFLMY